MCLPIAELPVSQGTKGSEAFIPLLRSCGSGAEESDLCQHLRRLRWRFWSSPSSSYSNYCNFKYIFLLDRNSPNGVVWVRKSCRSSPGSSMLTLCLSCQPFPEGFQSWMWRGLTFLLPFLFFGHVSWVIPSSLCGAVSAAAPHKGALDHTHPWQGFQGLILFAHN